MITKSLSDHYIPKATYNYFDKIIVKPTCALTKIALNALSTASIKAFTVGTHYLYAKSLSHTVDYFNKAKEDFKPCAEANAVRGFILKGPNDLIKEYWSEKSAADLLSLSYWISLYKDLTNIPGKSTQDPEFLERARYLCENNPSEDAMKNKLINLFTQLHERADGAKAFTESCGDQTPETCANTVLPQYWQQCHLSSAPDALASTIWGTMKSFLDTNILKPVATSTCSAYSADINYMLLSASVFAAITAGFFTKTALQTAYNIYTQPKQTQHLESRLLALETLMKAPKEVPTISLEDSNPPLKKDPLSLSQILDEAVTLQPPSPELIKLFHNIGLTNSINKGA